MTCQCHNREGEVCETKTSIAEKLVGQGKMTLWLMLCLNYTTSTTLSIWKVKEKLKVFFNLHICKRDVGQDGKAGRLQRDAWPICKVRTYQTETSQKIWLCLKKKNRLCFLPCKSTPPPPPPPSSPGKRWAFDWLELWRWVLAVEKVQVRPPSASAGPQAFRLRGQA